MVVMRRAAIYYRVSTAEQSTESQRASCEGAARGYEEVEVFEDVISGASSARSGLDALMAKVRQGRFAAVICYKLDRLGRSLPHLSQLILEFDRLGVALVAASQGIDTGKDNPVGRLQLNVLMAVAEFEREIIRERTREGLAVARAKGVKLGRPRGAGPKVARAKARMAELLKQGDKRSLKSLAGELGIGITTAHRLRRGLNL